MPSFSSNRPSLNRLVANILEKLGQLGATRPRVCRGILAAVCHDDPRLLPAGLHRQWPRMAKDLPKVQSYESYESYGFRCESCGPDSNRWEDRQQNVPERCLGVHLGGKDMRRYARICEQSGKLQLKNLKTGVNVLGESMHVLELRTSRRGIQLGKFFVNASDTAGDRDSRIKSSNTQISCLTLLVNLRITHHGP